MVNVYKAENNGLVKKSLTNSNIKDLNPIETRTWIDLNKPTLEILQSLSKLTNIPMSLLNSALDEEESAHIDNEDDNVLIVLDVPHIDKETNNISTKPFIIAYNSDYFLTISKYNNTLIPNLLNKVKNLKPQKQLRFTLLIIYNLAKEFISTLKHIDNQTKDVEKRLHTSMKNKEIFELMDINKTFVYISNAISANKVVLNKLLKSSLYKKYDEDIDLIEDTEVELNQAAEMCNLYRDILAGTMDAFASIISNNLNIVMKTLTIITIVISIPTLIASIFGMNVDLPFVDENKYGFYIIIAISAVLVILGAILLIYFTRNKKPKK